MNARAARLKKAEEAGCTPGAARPRPRAGAGAPITDPFAQFQRFQGQMEQLFLQWQRQQQHHQRLTTTQQAYSPYPTKIPV